ncbi:hypothetical protein I4U23_005843 [Adineta vaga]|nr:hypothetical protein I4U23_005843 [Adineta vaga]
MNNSSSALSTTEEPTKCKKDIAKDTIDSMRIRKSTSRTSVATIDWEIETSSSAIDLDIENLDKQFQQLSLEYRNNRKALRNDPNNKEIRKAIDTTLENLSQIQMWTSLMKTEEGFAIVKEAMLKQRQYEIDEALKLTKVQSAVDICFLMDCTGSMTRYIDITRTQICQLTNTIGKLYSTTPRLSFVGYSDIDEMIEKLDFTDDVNTFKAFLDKVRATGGDDACEDVFNLSNDKYPKGDPKTRELSKLLLDIKRLKVTYCTIQLNLLLCVEQYQNFM